MATAVQRATFLNMIIPIAIEQAKKHDMKIYPSVCIAQAIHESGWGTSQKMVRANALFGIKVGNSAWKFGTGTVVRFPRLQGDIAVYRCL